MGLPERPADRLVRGDAWYEFCDRLKVAGARVLTDDAATLDVDRAEGYRHLSRLTVYALQWFVDFHDPDYPAFHRYDDDVIKWGGPNADNHYLRAKIDPRGAYRLRFDSRGLRELIISTPEGEMQLEQYRVFEERHLSDLAVGADGHVEVVLSAERLDGNWIPLHPDADHVLVRLYVSDWAADAVPPVYIERIGREGSAPARLDPGSLAVRLDRAATWIERTVDYWPAFMKKRRGAAAANILSPPRAVPGGAADILYGGGFWQLAAGEGLLVECDLPRARYWSFQLYSIPWFESLDVANRSTSLNDAQTVVDADDIVRIVVAAEDPGLANWLDTEGRAEGMLSYRWVWAETAPVPRTRVVRLDALTDVVPPGAARTDPERRRAQLAARRAALAQRFRR